MKTVTFILGLLLIGLVVIAQNPHCHAVKKNGDSCHSTFVMKSGYCRAHDPNILRCGAAKADGSPCKMPVEKVGEKCRFHKVGKA